MKFNAKGAKKITGEVIEIIGAASFMVLIEKIELENPEEVIGLEEGKHLIVWLACLIPNKEYKSEAKEFLIEEVLNKIVYIIPDHRTPNKEGARVNGHVYVEENDVYVNRLLLDNDLVEFDNEMISSEMCKELKWVHLANR